METACTPASRDITAPPAERRANHNVWTILATSPPASARSVRRELTLATCAPMES
ncbi:hypothetical protein MAR_003190 [Mya arenaria]|uniref:Uncharacterized protein n=1 Tax=Mya arenaria TaxID=6604 RepID=A0ABY7G8E1_MYAAR|nr:hypothetical protein MAR_003190 [Mya arenaria]